VQMVGHLTAKRGPRITTAPDRHGIYGLTLASDFPFASTLAPGAGAADLTFACGDTAPPLERWDGSELVYASPPYPEEDGESEVLLWRTEGGLVVRFNSIADFYLRPDRIFCHRLAAEYHDRLSGRYTHEEIARFQETLIEIYFLGYVLALWLEWRGMPTLHASAVAVDGQAVAFLSSGGGGKSSLAVSLMHSGCGLLTDDILPVEHSARAYTGRPGYPQMRMWPGQAEHFLGRYENLDLVHPALSKRRVPAAELGSFCEAPQPLGCLYLPERRDPAAWGMSIEIRPVPVREAVMALIGYSFVPAVVQALGLHPHRLQFFSRMALQVPMRRVVYPSGFEHLPRVQEAILQNISGLVPVSRGA
jgi:hypothetical protein